MDFLPVHLRVPAAIASYSLCSGTMLLFNKLAMHYGASSCLCLRLFIGLPILVDRPRIDDGPPDLPQGDDP